ncbi:hypothetical protein F442_09228 [Phytophthora nicotianae P10297]|uniref:Uncharacterized protein n=1 Tax=Phytophthora nicotianae P10297 TaxID=1317064 RepID=W2ZD85_PHYNI|nr:hypothetical protein F442_09228 [Phytophthora nicotianae P10297]
MLLFGRLIKRHASENGCTVQKLVNTKDGYLSPGYHNFGQIYHKGPQMISLAENNSSLRTCGLLDAASLDATKEQGEVTDLVDSGRVKIQTPEPTELRINRHSNAKKND